MEIETPTLRVVAYNENVNVAALNGALDLVEQKQLNSQLQLATFQ